MANRIHGLEAKRKALGALSGRADPGSYGTNAGTNMPKTGIDDSQVIEKNGGREGIRTPGLLVANEALSQLSYSPPSSKNLILAEERGSYQGGKYGLRRGSYNSR